MPSPSPLAGEGGRAPRSGARPDEGVLPTLGFARKLRREMTDAERALWVALRDRRFAAYKFRRQVSVGNYIADFICFETRLIIEVDGSQHAESARDVERDAWLASQNFRVLRFWNDDVLRELESVLDAIAAAVRSRPSPARYPPPERERTEESYSLDDEDIRT